MTSRRGGMWGKVPMWVLARRDLSKTELRVYGILAARQNSKTGHCYPARQTIADDLGIHIENVKKALKSLRDKGLISWDHRADKSGRQTSNQYQIAYAKPFPVTVKGGERKRLSGGVNSTAKGGVENTPQTPKEHRSIEHSVDTTYLTDCSSCDELSEDEAREIIKRAIGFYKRHLGTDAEDAERKDLFPIAWKAYKAGEISLSEDADANDWVFEVF